MAIPKMYDVEFLEKDEYVQGEKYTIVDEFDKNPKFKSYMVGSVEFKGQQRLLGMNVTSYRYIKAVYGKDTKNWIGKKLIFSGMEKCGDMGMMGRIFRAIPEANDDMQIL